MSYEEYKETQAEFPYTLIVPSKEGVLYYFGERHSFDSHDSQWVKQKEFWFSFLKETENQKRIVFTEGGVRTPLATEEETIRQSGGMGLAAFQAKEAGIDVYSPEPNIHEELSLLEKEFSRDEIAYYYFARMVHQWGRTMEPRVEAQKYLESFLNRAGSYTGWSQYDFSWNHMVELHKEFHGVDFNPNDTKFFYERINPVNPEFSITNKVANRLSRFRDEHIVEQIEKYMKEGYFIFAQYGGSHVVMQEPLLKEVLA